MSIAVVLCIYEPNELVFSQLDSIVNQTIPPAHLYISDDSPNEDFESVINDYSSRYTSITFKYRRGPMKGVIHNFLSAIISVTEDYVFLCDQDDYWFPNKIEIMLPELSAFSGPALVYSDAIVTDVDSGLVISNSFFKYQNISSNVLLDDSILFRNCVQGASSCINRQLINKLKESLDYTPVDSIVMHDWWLAILAKYYGNTLFINKPLIKYNQHQNNVIGARKNTFWFFRVLKEPRKYFKNLYNIAVQANEFIGLNTEIFYSRGVFFLDMNYCGKFKRWLAYMALFIVSRRER